MATTKSKTALDNELRANKVKELMELLTASGEEAMQVGGNVIAFPTLDEAGNDAWIEITVKVPKGARLGKGEGFEGYDGYGLAEFYVAETKRKDEEAELKRKNAEAKKNARSASKKKKEEVVPDDMETIPNEAEHTDDFEETETAE